MDKFLKGELAKKVKKPRGMVTAEVKKEEEQEIKEEQGKKYMLSICSV